MALPRGIRLITSATAVRWFGWGLIEALLPIFFFTFAASHLGAGALRSLFMVTFLIALPIAGAMTRRMRSVTIIIIGLALYPIVGLAYFLAGAFGMVWFAVLARGVNGIGYALDVVGRGTYIRNHARQERIGLTLGSLETWANLAWILAVLLGFALLQIVEYHALFLFIIPTTVIAIILIARVPVHKGHHASTVPKGAIGLSALGTFLQEIMLWKSDLKRLAALTFLLGIIFSIIDFFFPVFLYESGQGTERIIFYTLIFSLPMLFGSVLGRAADRVSARVYPWSFVAIAALFTLLAFVNDFRAQLVIAFLMGIIAVFLELAIDVTMTRAGDPRRYGTLSSTFLEVAGVSAIIGPLVVGFSIDRFGLQMTILGLALLALLAAPFFRFSTGKRARKGA